MKHMHAFMREHAVWIRVILFSLTLFFIRLADGAIGFWAPAQIESVFDNQVVVGLIISIQSIVGFFADLIIPHMLRAAKARPLAFAAALLACATSLAFWWSVAWPFALLFVVTMIGWGVYYELMSFATYQFMGNEVPVRLRSGAWGVGDMFLNFAYFLGPLAATFLLVHGAAATETAILLFLACALVLLWIFRDAQEHSDNVERQDVNPWEELRRWSVLSSVIWPAIMITLMLGCIDATFWVTGVLWSQALSQTNALGNFIIPLYQFPPLLVGIVIAKWGVYKGKKILAEKFLLAAGVLLACLGLFRSLPMVLSLVFSASVALSLTYPLLEGVYTDIVARMGREKKDLIGLINAVSNVSYVFWPPVAGMIATMLDQRLTFAIVGGMAALVALILLFVTPKKLRLPQQEIQSWDE